MGTTLFGISKTTIEGVFSFLITTLTFITGYQGFVSLMNPAQSKTWLIASAVATFVVGLLNLWLRMLQGDAPTTPPATSNASGVAAKLGIFLLIAMLPLCLLASACSSWERTTFQSLSASKAVIDQAAIDYNTGAIPKSSTNQALITQARNAQTTAVDSMVAYEGIKTSAASNTSGLSAQQATVDAALAAIVPLVAQIKALYATKTSMIVKPERNPTWTLQPYKALSVKFRQTPMLFFRPSLNLTRL